VPHAPLGQAAPRQDLGRSHRRHLHRVVTRGANHAPVLMYHGIGRVEVDPFGLFISPERFNQQMQVLRSLGLRGVSMSELGDALNRREARGLVGITFDDAYRDLFDWGPPILTRYGFTATVFALSGLLGDENLWDPPPRRRLMDERNLRDLVVGGMEVGSHGASHVRLAGLDADRLADEVSGSRTTLARVTGEQPRSFCYPYGSVDAAAVQAVRAAGYSYACAITAVPRLPRDLVFPRVGVTERDRRLRFAAKLALRGR
jgi:peptidoglycan/xylan/chitin deacetylase (PgdA/CDA1 family)